MWLVYNDLGSPMILNGCSNRADAEECALAWAEACREAYYYATGIIVPLTHYEVKILKVQEY